MGEFVALAMASAGVGVGTFIGALIGLGMRQRKGNSEGLIAGSVLLTSLAVAVGAMGLVMIMKAMWG